MENQIPMDLSISAQRDEYKIEINCPKIKLELEEQIDEDSSKYEENLYGTQTDEQEVWIKQELECDVDNNLLVQVKLETQNVVTPKLEHPSNTEESSKECKVALEPKVIVKKNTKKKKIKEIDEEYIPIKIGKKKKKVQSKQESNIKPTVRGKSRNAPNLIYSDEVVKHIEIVTINEEERQIEHRELFSARQHMRHTCEPCAVGFVVEDAYIMHMKVHSPEAGDHECEICHSRLKSADILYRHRLRHYRRYRCGICHTRHKDKDAAACHVMTDHAGQAFACTHCGKGFKRPQYLKRHVEQYHTKPLQLECPHCGRVFHERGWYRSHIRTHSEEVRTKTVKLKFTCATCYREFSTKAMLKRHLATHDAEGGAGAVTCRVCRTHCRDRHVLRVHYMHVHNTKWTPKIPENNCPECPRVLATPAMLRRHIKRMHTDRTKNYICDHCQRRYLTKGEVRAHIMWSHLPMGAGGGHACAWGAGGAGAGGGCGRVFRTPALLRAHEARHAGTPPRKDQPCEHCGKCFTNKQVLRRHLKSHSNQMYPCNECGMLFKTEPYVKVHYKLKHLNMTRAEINAERKRKKMIMIDKNIEPKNDKSKCKITKSMKKVKRNVVHVDPLFVGIECNTSVKIEMEDTHVPLFETFIDVHRE